MSKIHYGGGSDIVAKDGLSIQGPSIAPFVTASTHFYAIQ